MLNLALLGRSPEALGLHHAGDARLHVHDGRGNPEIDTRELRVQARLLVRLLGGRRGEARPIVAAVGVRGLIEDVEELVVLLVADGVVLVAVALGAARGDAHPDLHGRVDPVLHGEHAELLVVGAPLGVRHRVPVERGGETGLHGRVGEQVARQLLHRELVEGEVPVVGARSPSPGSARSCAGGPSRGPCCPRSARDPARPPPTAPRRPASRGARPPHARACQGPPRPRRPRRSGGWARAP